jgi:hypothetical protein
MKSVAVVLVLAFMWCCVISPSTVDARYGLLRVDNDHGAAHHNNNEGQKAAAAGPTRRVLMEEDFNLYVFVVGSYCL